MKEIGILEFQYHTKFLYTIAKICKTEKTNVTIFTSKKIYDRLKTYLKNPLEYTIILQKEKEGYHAFLKRVEKICNEKIDLLFLNTVPVSTFYLPRYFGFNPKCKTIMTAHTVNAWFNKKPIIDIKKPMRTLDTNLSCFLANRFILPKFSAINVIYPPMKDYVKNKMGYNKKIFTLPWNFYDENQKSKEKKSNKINIVAPGQIEEHRRDYDTLLDAFEPLFKKHNDKINLVLLGYPVGIYGSRIQKRCKELKNKGYNITYFDSFVPEKTYNETMKTFDFIILPIKIKSCGLGVIQEIYGLTKGSAAVAEGIQYGRPLIAPSEFRVIKELESSILQYSNSKDLEKIITKLIQNPDQVVELKRKAYENSQHFTLEVLRGYFTREILDKLGEL